MDLLWKHTRYSIRADKMANLSVVSFSQNARGCCTTPLSSLLFDCLTRLIGFPTFGFLSQLRKSSSKSPKVSCEAKDHATFSAMAWLMVDLVVNFIYFFKLKAMAAISITL